MVTINRKMKHISVLNEKEKLDRIQQVYESHKIKTKGKNEETERCSRKCESFKEVS